MVCRWKNKSDSGLESVENATKYGRPKSASCDEIVSKVKEIVETDARYKLLYIIYKVVKYRELLMK